MKTGFITMITAHAGAEGTETNTLESIRTLAACGVDCIEVDVRPQGGRLVMSHDKLVLEKSYDTLESCFLEIVKQEGMKINVDLKVEGLVRQVDELAKRCGMEGRYILTGGVGDSEIPYIMEHEIEVFYNAENLPENTELISGIEEKGFHLINMEYTSITDALLEKADRLSAWTVEDENSIRKLLRAGIKNITTCSPKAAMRLRQEIQSGIQLVPADVSLAGELAEYYRRNQEFLRAFEPAREDDFFTCEYQKKILESEMLARENQTSYRFYIKTMADPQKIIGVIGLNHVVWGAFRSAFMGYKLDEAYTNRGYMSLAVSMLTEYAFEELHLHRIEANVMPRNKGSLRVLEKNGFEKEGVSKYYLNINGVWEDHIHMVKINYRMH